MSQLSVIRGNVRANLGENSARFFDNADLNRWIGEAYRHYSILMVENGEGYFQVSTNLGFTSGIATVSLAALSPAYFSIARLERNTATGTIPLKPSERRYEKNSTVTVSSGDSYIPTYRMQGLTLILEPTPTSTETGTSTTGLKLDYNYLPTFPTSSSGDTFTFDTAFSTIYEPMIELYATIGALESKDGMGGVSDVNTFRARLEKWEQVFMDSLERYEAPDSVQYSGNDYRNTYYY